MQRPRPRQFAIVLAILAITAGLSAQEQVEPRIKLRPLWHEDKVNVFIGDSLFTSFLYDRKLEKPVLYPVLAPNGAKVTRHHPGDPKAGERVDHPHHMGVWLNYGFVNGLDFWNNSKSKSASNPEKYGWIRIDGSPTLIEEKNSMVYRAFWQDHQQKTLLEEETTLKFAYEMGAFIVYRNTKLTAVDSIVSLDDNKEGLFAIRVTRALEHPSKKDVILSDADGLPMSTPTSSNEGVTGQYFSSEGIRGKDVWGTRADWMQLKGVIQGDSVRVSILDHPENVGFPTYWHARDYGLFSANPLGQSVFSKGKNELNVSLRRGDSLTLKFALIVESGTAQIDIRQQGKDFAKMF